MHIGAAEPEGTDCRTPGRTVFRRPVPEFRIHKEGAVLEVDMLIFPLKVNGGGNLLPGQGQGHLNHRSHPGCRHGVADIGFHRADGTVAAFIGIAAVDLRQGGDLNGIPQLGAGAVGLHIADGARIYGEPVIDLLFQLHLGFGAGGRDTVCPAVLVKAAAANHGMNIIPVPDRFRQGFEKKDTHAFAGNKAVGIVVKGVALPCGGQHAGLARHDQQFFCGHEADAPGQGHIAFTADDALAGLVDGNQGGGACRINGNTGAGEIQEIGDTCRQDGRGRPHEAVGVDLLEGFRLCPQVIPLSPPHKNPAFSAGKGFR